ncbi:DNA translocase ftsK [Erwinia piriflorinigrans CFBP 5888]|uniref:DNA translocase ftsK n=1 Tax=Erwinia piriflorinigrans CFBP 5888 TaxID=1161919 RepID=V5Z6Z7_9GAMM|nr:DNA translocase ftsK [Erwinia piriflorinigrans CFBP 5888]
MSGAVSFIVYRHLEILLSQEYSEDKEVTLQPLSGGRRLLEASLIIVALFAVYLMVALVSFNPSDPSWSQTAWHEPIHNIGGGVAAWLADTLFFMFGVMAYAIPPVILGLCWITFRQRHSHDYIDYFAVALRLIGVLALVVTSCGLAALNADDIWYFASGGVIGSLLSNAIAPYLSGSAATLTLLCIWAAGLTLYTGWSWLTIAEKIGAVVMGVLTFASNRSRGDEEWQREEHDSDDEQDESSIMPRHENSAHADDVLLSKPKAVLDKVANGQSAAELAKSTMQPAGEATAGHAQQNALTTAAIAPGQTSSIEIGQQAVHPEQAAVATKNDPADPPLYRFEMPSDVQTPAPSMPLDEDEGPQMGNWRDASTASPFDFSTPHASHPASVAAAATGAALGAVAHSAKSNTPFMPGFTATSDDDVNRQVKQGIGPELPRPKPVKLPTRRELASYGIKLPSQRMAEEKAKEQEQLQAQQHSNDNQVVEDEDAVQQAELANQFAAQQQQRYASETRPEAKNDDSAFMLDTRGAFDFSPKDDFVEEGLIEPLLTLSSVESEQQQPAAVAPVPAWQQSPSTGTAHAAVPAWQQPPAPEPAHAAVPARQQPPAPERRTLRFRHGSSRQRLKQRTLRLWRGNSRQPLKRFIQQVRRLLSHRSRIWIASSIRS